MTAPSKVAETATVSTPARRISVQPVPLVAAVLVGLLVGVAAAALTALRDPAYTSTSKLLINQPGAVSLAEGEGLLLKLSRLRLLYVGLVDTPVIKDPVAQRLGVPAGGLGGSVGAVATPTDLNISIIATSDDPRRAEGIAQAAALELREYVQQTQAEDGVPEAQRYALTLIQPATEATGVAQSARRPLLIGVTAGTLAAAAAGVGLLHLRRRA